MNESTNTHLSGKVAIGAGGERGFGRAMALALAEAGASVLIMAAKETTELERVAFEGPEGRILPFLGDVNDPTGCEDAVQAAVDAFGDLDILVNNAGRGMKYVSGDFLTAPTRFWETNPEVWRMIIDANVNGPFLMARAAVPVMLKRGWRRIINVSMNRETMRRAGFSP